MRSIILLAHNIRSTHNVGSLLRTADGFGVEHLYFTGITPYPATKSDERLPHISRKLNEQIDKTALGAASMIKWSHEVEIEALITRLKKSGYRIIGLEQASNSTLLNHYKPPKKCAILLGTEVNGIEEHLLRLCDDVIEIGMYGKKESLNVVQAAAVSLYALREA